MTAVNLSSYKFLNVHAKLGSMKKIVKWVIYPYKGDGIVVIQSDRRIARINLETGKGRLSKSANYPNSVLLTNTATSEEIDASFLVPEIKKLIFGK